MFLYIPHLSNSFISVQDLIEDLNILVIFFSLLETNVSGPYHEENNFNY